jgi:hypothetical protein
MTPRLHVGGGLVLRRTNGIGGKKRGDERVQIVGRPNAICSSSASMAWGRPRSCPRSVHKHNLASLADERASAPDCGCPTAQEFSGMRRLRLAATPGQHSPKPDLARQAPGSSRRLHAPRPRLPRERRRCTSLASLPGCISPATLSIGQLLWSYMDGRSQPPAPAERSKRLLSGKSQVRALPGVPSLSGDSFPRGHAENPTSGASARAFFGRIVCLASGG